MSDPTAVLDDSGFRRFLRSPWAPIIVVVVPFVVATIRTATRTWYPVLDMAMTEFRVRDVGGQYTPLIGLPGRIGSFPDQGSHPGPLSYYLLAPVYRLLGSTAWSLLVGAIIIGAAAVIACVLIARRLGGQRLQWAVVVLVLVVVQGYGFGVVGQPWNPYLPLLAWLAVLIAVWAVVVGDSGVLWVATLAGSLCAQTHLPYVGLAGSIVVIATLLVAWRWRSAERGTPERFTTGRNLAIGAGVGIVVWIPSMIDQLFGSQNLSMIVDYFRHPPELPIGERAGIELLLRHLDITRLLGGSVSGSGTLVEAASRAESSVLPGVLMVVVWIAAAIAAVIVVRDRRLTVLHGLIAVCLVLELTSMVRIFGKIWYYLTLWAWSVTALMVFAVAWTAFALVARSFDGERARARLDQIVTGVLVVLGVFSFATLMVQAATVDVPEPRLSRSLGAVVGPTVDALEAGVAGAPGTDGRYTVLWNDAFFFGSQGYGLVSELERRGFDAGAPYTWRVPITEHRVIDVDDADVVVQFVTGAYLDQWRSEPSAVEVATFEPRTPEEQAEYEGLRIELMRGLAQLPIDVARYDDLVTMAEFNLFGVQLDPLVPPELQRIVNRMLELGQPTAVFLVPPEFYADQP